jgi:WD40 repeat protein
VCHATVPSLALACNTRSNSKQIGNTPSLDKILPYAWRGCCPSGLHEFVSFVLFMPQDYTSRINSMDFCRTEDVLVTASDDDSIRVYNIATGTEQGLYTSKKYGCRNICFTHSPDCVIYASRKSVSSLYLASYGLYSFLDCAVAVHVQPASVSTLCMHHAHCVRAL